MKRFFLSALAVTALVAACSAEPPSRDEDEDDGVGASGAGGSATGASSAGGIGGAGGANPGPCGTDCSLISAPPCHVAVCNEGMHPGPVGACVVVPGDDGAACDDGVFCTIDDSCSEGMCIGGPANDCGMQPGGCDEIICDEAAKTCFTQPLANGTACTPADLCEAGGACTNGLCVGQPKDCFFAPIPNECHVSVCNPESGMCEPTPGNDGASCTDTADLCTIGKTCTGGTCAGGTPKDCSHLTMGCNLGVCDATTGQCTTMAVMNGQLCDDLDACTTGEICNNSMCGGGGPVTVCELNGDGCCPAACTAVTDLDCACGLDKIELEEIYIGGTDYATLTNSSTCALDLNPLFILFDDPTLTDVHFDIPAFMLAAGATVVITEGAAGPGELSTGTNIGFSGTRSGMVALCDGACSLTNGSNVIDAMQWQGSQAPPARPAGVTFSPGPFLGLTSSNESTTSAFRTGSVGNAPSFALSDWTTGAPTQ